MEKVKETKSLKLFKGLFYVNVVALDSYLEVVTNFTPHQEVYNLNEFLSEVCKGRTPKTSESYRVRVVCIQGMRTEGSEFAPTTTYCYPISNMAYLKKGRHTLKIELKYGTQKEVVKEVTRDKAFAWQDLISTEFPEVDLLDVVAVGLG